MTAGSQKYKVGLGEDTGSLSYRKGSLLQERNMSNLLSASDQAKIS